MQAAARMGVAPEGFWRLSLKEWRMLTAGPVQAAPLGRGMSGPPPPPPDGGPPPPSLRDKGGLI